MLSAPYSLLPVLILVGTGCFSPLFSNAWNDPVTDLKGLPNQACLGGKRQPRRAWLNAMIFSMAWWVEVLIYTSWESMISYPIRAQGLMWILIFEMFRKIKHIVLLKLPTLTLRLNYHLKDQYDVLLHTVTRPVASGSANTDAPSRTSNWW